MDKDLSFADRVHNTKWPVCDVCNKISGVYGKVPYICKKCAPSDMKLKKDLVTIIKELVGNFDCQCETGEEGVPCDHCFYKVRLDQMVKNHWPGT